MAGIARVGDIVGMGGLLVGPFSPDVTVNGRPVALEACIFTPHGACFSVPPVVPHCFGVVFSFPEGVTVNGVPPLVKGSIATCRDTVLTASSDVLIAGSGLGSLVSMAVSFASGDVGQLSGLEKIAIQAGADIVSGQDIGQTLTGAAISAGVSAGVGAAGDAIKKL